MTKDYWQIKYEEISEDLASQKISRKEAIDRWLRMGIDREQAEKEANIADGTI